MSNHTPEQPKLEFPTVKLCECGCGLPAPIAKLTDSARGYIKGQPRRFIIGHHNHVRPIRPIAERFWEKVDKRGPNECWLWQASLDGKGYGQFVCEGRRRSAHGYSYELEYGPIPEGNEVCHTCDNPPCVNPSHLFAGTHLDNMKDCRAKGRYKAPRGERNAKARFTNTQVAAMRQEFARYSCTITEFARLHDISPNAMKAILNRKSYQDA